MSTITLLEHQYEFVHATDKVVGLISGIGAGKSYAGRCYIVKKAIDNPGTLGFIGTNTYAQLRDTVLTPLFAELDMMGLPYHYNSQDGMLTIDQAKIKCASLENFNTLRGIEIGWCYLDEIRDLRQEAFMMLLGRLRCRKSKALEMRATTTPNGFDWIYDLFAGEKRNLSFKMIHARSKDNPHLPDGYLDSLLANYDSKFAEQELEGSFVNLTSGKIYHGFDRHKHIIESPIDKDTRYLYVGIDFNVDPLCAVIAEVNTHNINIVDEIHLSNSNTFEAAKEIRKRYPTHSIVCIPDATGKARKTSSLSSDHAILESAGFHVRSSRINPLREDRFNTVNKLFQDNKLTINPNCVKLIKNLEQEIHGKNPADIGHINDALGYLCYFYEPLTPVRQPSKTIRFN